MLSPLVSYTLNVQGRLLNLSAPQVMGILNLTPDSFYAASRVEKEESVRMRVRQIMDEGGAMIDVGACSTRPGAESVDAKEEMRRLRNGMKAVREEAPDAVVSVDTFRADVAKMAVEELGADIVNDVSGGLLDERMFNTVTQLGVPYILTDAQSTNMKDMMLYFASKVQQLRDLGQKDIILDPGYGFGKTLEENYILLNRLHCTTKVQTNIKLEENYILLNQQEMLTIFELPLLVGVSRKSMIYRLLDCTPNEALNGTTVLNTIALTKGTNILRVHDVKAAVEVVSIIQKLQTAPTLNP